MKKYRVIWIVVLIVLAFVMLHPSNAIAAPMMKNESVLSEFDGKWVSTRVSGGVLTAQSLKIKCDPNKMTCRMELIVERSGSCTANNNGEPTGLTFEFNGPVNIEGSTISSVEAVDHYCLTEPPTYHSSWPEVFTYNMVDDTLTGYGGSTWDRMKAKSELSEFDGKWVSTRWTGGEQGWLTAQSLKIKCDPNKMTCRMKLIVEKSGTCTANNNGEPTGLMWMYNGPVYVVGSSIHSIVNVDAYCLSKPPTYLTSFPAWYTYNEVDDTLSDFSLITVWERK